MPRTRSASSAARLYGRATSRRAQPKAKRQRGFEERDAPPTKVALAAAGFYAVMLVGLGFAATTIAWVAPHMGLVAHAPARPSFPAAALPALLVDPVAHRRAVEGAAQRHLDPARIEQAMAQVEAQSSGVPQ